MAYAFFSMAAHDNCDPVNLELAKEIGLSVPFHSIALDMPPQHIWKHVNVHQMIHRNGLYISYAAYTRIELVLPKATPPLSVCPWRPSLIKHGSNRPHSECRLKNTKRNRALS